MSDQKPTGAGYAPQLKPPCSCDECAARHGDQAPSSDEVEVARLRDDVAQLRAALAAAAAEAGELSGRCGYWLNEAEVLASRRNVEAAERDDYKRLLDAACLCVACAEKFAVVSGEPHRSAELRRSEEQLRAFSRLVAERDGAIAEAVAAKRERDGFITRLVDISLAAKGDK